MGMSDERRKQREKKKALKQARMRGEKPKSTSRYALKVRGIYGENSPYRTGNWGVRMKKLRGMPAHLTEPSAEIVAARIETWGR